MSHNKQLKSSNIPAEIATVSAPVAAGLVMFLKREGYDHLALFNQVGIDIKTIDDPYQMIRLDHFTHLLELAAQLSGRPLLGLELGSQQNPAKWGAFGYLVLNSPTVGAALNNMASFLKPAQGGTVMNYIIRNDHIGIEYSIVHPKVKYKNQDAEFAMAYVKHLVDQLCGHSIEPSAVYFEHDPMDTGVCYKKILGVTPYFDQPINTILFPRSFQNHPVPSADLQLFPIIKKHLTDMLSATPDEFDLIATVTHHIKQTLPSAQCRLENIANIMAIGIRTLQRQLKQQDTNFEKILDNTRKELAIQHMDANSLEIKEISFLLGFSDSSAFIKAFKKWTQKTPGQYKKERQCHGR